MKNKQQILHIHGGEPDTGYEDYMDRLKNCRFTLNNKETLKWNKRYREFLNQDQFEIILPMMPLGWRANYDDWKIWFERHFEFLNDGVILVGHSLGGNFLAKYLYENVLPISVKQLHLVAPSHSKFEDNFAIKGKPKKFSENSIGEVYIYHSTDDEVVPISESEKYHTELPNSQFHRFADRGHFLEEEFPELFENIKSN